jgi:type IV pilus assembly protein PilQ
LLTSRGQIAVDARTNSLIIRDTRDNLKDVIPEIRKLDVPARQVLIEARIVNINVTYEEELGIRFGVSNSRHLTGTFQGANSLTQGTGLPFVTNAGGTVDPTQRLNFNIPAAQLFDGSNPGSIAIALAHIGPALLDLELSALEGEDHAKIVAKPRVITSNQQKAIIQTGEEIPYQEATSSGATSVTFKNAVLSLEIVPQITPNNKIILDLKATEDSRGANVNIGAPGTTTTTVPAINTQEVQSHVLLNNNETIVLGGVYKESKDHAVDRVPFFGSLPLIGALFRHTHDQASKQELLIFITPKIINPTKNKVVTAEHKAPQHWVYKVPQPALYKGDNS